MNRRALLSGAAVVGVSDLVGQASLATVLKACSDDEKDLAPIVFQAAGPSVASTQSMVDAYRAALGGANNGNTPGPSVGGRREINWDGGGSTATSPAPTPFDGFSHHPRRALHHAGHRLRAGAGRGPGGDVR